MELLFSEMTPQERYKFLTAVVIPRPVAFVTSRNAEGVTNAAPFSFFNVFSEEPATVVLGISARPDGRRKDTILNIERAGEFVVNMVDKRVIEAMHIASADVPPDESEIDYSDVTLAPSRIVGVGRIAEAPASLECRLSQVIQLSPRRSLVLGEVLCVHVLDEIVDPTTRRIIPAQYSPIARLYGDHYAWLGERYTRAIPPYEEIRAQAAPRAAE